MNNIIKKIKEIFNRILLFYYRIVKLHTGYRIPNKIFLLFIIIISVTSIFLRNNILDYFQDNIIMLSVLFFLGCINIIFIQFNLLCRITITLYKGIPYFNNIIRWSVRYGYIGLSYLKKWYVSFLVFNFFLIVMGVIVLIRLYSIVYTYDLSIFQIIIVYNPIISIYLYFSYINKSIGNYEFKGRILFGIDENLSFIKKLILLVFPTLILLNLYSYFDSKLLTKMFRFKTIYCQPDDGNGYSQTNKNIQESSKSSSKNNKINKNLQGNKNTQLSGTTNTTNQTNINNQFNQNQQINTPLPLREGGRDGERMIKYHYVEQIQNQYRNHSFWENIIYLDSLKGKNILSNSFINERINYILGEALEKSRFNQYFYNNPSIKSMQTLLCPETLYFRYNLVPVYFNNYYEVYHLFINNNRITFNKIYSIHNECFNMFEFYQYIQENNKLPIPRISRNINGSILHSISNMILKVTRGLISPDSIIASSNNPIFEAYKMAVSSGQIEKTEGVNIKRVFGFELLVITAPPPAGGGGRGGFTGYYLIDNIDQLKFLVTAEIELIQSNWESFVNSPICIDVIKRSSILSNEYIVTGTLNYNQKNIGLLLEFNYKNNQIIGILPVKYTSPEMRHEFHNMLIDFKQKLIIIKVIQEYLSRS